MRKNPAPRDAAGAPGDGDEDRLCGVVVRLAGCAYNHPEADRGLVWLRGWNPRLNAQAVSRAP